MSNERTCVVCGASYRYCPHCDQYSGEPRWKFLFHDQNCHDIYGVLNAYGAGEIDKDKAKSELSKLDLSKRNTFSENFKDLINEIYGYKPTTPTKVTEQTKDSDKD